MEAQRRYPDTKQIIYLTNGSGLGAAVLTEDMIWSMEPGHIETLPELNPYGAKTTCVFTNTETSCLHAVTSGIGIENIYLQQTQEKVEERPMTINFPITDSDDDEIERKKSACHGRRRIYWVSSC